MTKPSGVVRDFRNYLAANAITALVSLIAIPVYSRLLEPADYGILSVFNSAVTLLVAILPLGMHSAIGRYYYEGKDDYPELIGTTVILSVSAFAVMSILLIPWWFDLAALISAPSLIIPLVLAVSALRIIQSFHNQLFAARKESLHVAVSNLLRVMGEFGVAIVLLLLLQDNLYLGPIGGQLVAASALAVFCIWKLRAHTKFNFQSEHARYVLAFGVPLIVYQLGGIILGAADRFMIAAILGTSETGVYALSYNLGMTVSLVFVAVSQAWVPYYYTFMREKRYEEHDRQLELVIRLICTCGLLVGVIGAEVARPVIGPAFRGGLNLVGIVAISYVWRALGQAYTRNFQFAKKTALSSGVFVVAALVNVLLNWIFLPHFGIAAAAYTTLASFMVMLVLAWMLNKRVVRLHTIAVKRWITPVSLVCAAIALSTYLDYAAIEATWRIVFKVLVFLTVLPLVVGRTASAMIRAWLTARKARA